MANYLITGFHGTPHVTAENDRGIFAALFGAGRHVLPVGEKFRAEYIGNNTVRIYDGKLIDGGAAAGIPAGEYIDLYVPEAGQGKYRTDLIAFQYEKDANTQIETGSFIVLSGTEAATAADAAEPALRQQDLLSGDAVIDQFPLYRVEVASTVISEPVALFEPMGEHKNVVQQVDGLLTTIGGVPVHAGGNTLIAYGSYSGVGAFGSSTPNTLTFDFKPFFVWIGTRVNTSSGATNAIMASFLRPGKGAYITSEGVYTQTVTWGDRSLSWYRGKASSDESDADAKTHQLNSAGYDYYYIAIGIAGEG